MNKSMLALAVLLTGCAHTTKQTTTAPTTAPTTAASATKPDFLGEWFDIDGNSWQLSEAQPGSFFIISNSASSGPPVFPKVESPGKLEAGFFTTVWREAAIMNRSPLSFFVRVDTRVRGVLIVTVNNSQRFELTRDKDLLTRPAPSTLPDQKQLAADLRSGDWNVRREAIRAIGEHQPEGAEKDLIAALGDEFLINKVLAIRGLARLKDPTPAIPALVSCLIASQPSLENAAKTAIIQYGPRIAPDLLPFLDVDPKLNPAWISPLRAALATIFASWDAADLSSLGASLAKQSATVQEAFFYYVAPELKPAGPATDIVLSFMELREPIPANKPEYDVEYAIKAIARFADPRAEEILAKWQQEPWARNYDLAFRNARSGLELTRRQGSPFERPNR